ncbi:MAG: sporulation integral membrane protein YlbJ [Clostridia bacterium]|nr:sporulation integral membrane protein YlbJ [Clostridia bacterium]
MCKYFFISIKKNIIPFLLLLFTIGLVIFSKDNLDASKIGLLLWANNIVPSLLPFFIATNLLSHTSLIYKFGKLLEPIMRPFFNVPGIGSFPLIMGIISGYPTGAKIVSDLKEKNLLTDIESERLIAFTNNSGPLFILGTVGISMFSNNLIGILLLITHVLSCLTVGFLFKFWKNNKNLGYKSSKPYLYTKNISFSDLGEILSKSILDSIKTILLIGGFVILFSVILSILNESKILPIVSTFILPLFNLLGMNKLDFPTGFLSGLLEVTNGLNIISNTPYKNIAYNIILSSFLLGFGGFSVLLQVYSITSKANISIKPYLIGKVLHGIIASIYTFIFIYSIPIFNSNL